ncbi:hypothetical protein ACFL17_08670 [Pseudomonadota bacterium]
MSGYLLLSFKIYLLAIIISLGVAVMIKLIVLTLSVVEPQSKKTMPVSSPALAPIPSGEIVAAISAAIYAALGAHRIIHIEERGRGRAWAVEGRTAHHTSHNVPHRPHR